MDNLQNLIYLFIGIIAFLTTLSIVVVLVAKPANKGYNYYHGEQLTETQRIHNNAYRRLTEVNLLLKENNEHHNKGTITINR